MSSAELAADEQAMRDALGEAKMALAHGDVPVGAVVVHNGEIIASRHNEREKSGDRRHMPRCLLCKMLPRASGAGDSMIAPCTSHSSPA